MFDSSPTIGGLLLELADRVGLAVNTDSGLVLPDGTDQDRLRNALKAGAQAVTRARQWSWLSIVVRVTCDPTGQSADCVDGSASAYWVDRAAYTPRTHEAFVTVASGSGGYPIPLVAEDAVRRLRTALPNDVGAPACGSVVERRPTSDGDRVRPRSVLLLDRKPDQAYTIRWNSNRRFNDFRETTERPYWDTEADEAVLAHGVAHLARYGMLQKAIDREQAERYAKSVTDECWARNKPLVVGAISTVPSNGHRNSISYSKIQDFDGTFIHTGG